MTRLIVAAPSVILIIAIIVVTIRRQAQFDHVFGHKHGESVFSVDQYAHDSKLASWSAGYKITVSLLLMLICVACSDVYVTGTIIVVCAFVTVVLGHLSLGRYINLLTIPLVFMITGSIVILIEFSGVRPVDSLATLKIANFYVFMTAAGLSRVAVLWGRAFGAISAMYMMTLSTPSNELFSVLDRVHCPTLITELMNMMYRFIFTMMDTQVEMNNAAKSRLGYRNFRTALSTFGHIGGNLLIVSFKKANDYYNALESRLYRGKLSFLVDEKKLTAWQIIAAVLLFSYLLLIWYLTR